VAERAVPELDRARSRSVRLVISIPVLSLLVVLGSGTVLYVYLSDLAAESPWYLPQTRLSLERAALVVLWLSIAISLASSVLGYILARQIVRPIRELMGTMDAISRGDLTTKVQPISLGEFGQLGNTFNRMMDQLNTLFEERDRQLHESLSGGHILVDRSGKVIEADAAARRIFSASHSELLGADLLQGRPSLPLLQRNPTFGTALSEAIEGTLKGQPVSRTISLLSSKGEEPSRFLLSSLRLESGDSQGAHVMLELRDISGIAKFYEQIQRADRLAAVGTLATGIAHEVRNPLASIRGMVQLLTEFGDGDPTSADYLQRILREVDRVDKLISEIMDFAHADESPAESVDLSVMLQEVVGAARMTAGDAASGIEVEWTLDPELPAAMLRYERLRQALLNLVVNAFQHCIEIERGPIRVSTSFDAGRRQLPACIRIANPGEPLDETMRERIFEPFFTTKAEGTGLGLPIAYQMIHSNGGELEVLNEDGFIIFQIALPMDLESSSTSRAVRRIQLMGITAEELAAHRGGKTPARK
jgi:nitrogen fixation/metabolism regulation signal transduction histidine kinase